MEKITSESNNLIKKISKLIKDRKYRFEYKEYVAEGLRWVIDALRDSTMCDMVSQIAIKSTIFDSLDLESLNVINNFSDKLFILSDAIFDKVSDTKNSQGFLAVLKIKEPKITEQLKFCLILDRVRDPGNLGTIIRTACAAGFTDIFCYDCADIYSPKVVRSCMTGIYKTNLHEMQQQDISYIVSKIKALGIKIYGAALGGEDMYGFKAINSACIVIGNEANGISESLLRDCDSVITIPMFNIESLNAAVSAAILMYHLKFNK